MMAGLNGSTNSGLLQCTEGVEAQIDRLNLALVSVFDTNRLNREAESIVSTKRSFLSLDEFSVASSDDPSLFFLESKLEDALIDNDRQRMLLEDFRSHELREKSAKELFIDKEFVCGALRKSVCPRRESELLTHIQVLNEQIAQLKTENQLSQEFSSVAREMARAHLDYNCVDQ